MRREDEDALMRGLATAEPGGGPYPRDVVERLGLVEKVALRTLEKWSKKGWYEWGVVIDLGWLTESGKEEARRRGQVSTPPVDPKA